MPTKNKKYWKILWVLGIMLAVYFVIVKPLRLVLIGVDGLAQQLPDTKNILPEYRDLLDSLSNTGLKTNHTFNSRKRQSVSVGTYRHKYLLIFFKIDTTFSYLLRERIFLKKNKTNFSSGVDYVSVIYGDVESSIDFNFAISKKPDPQKIYLTIEGDSTKTIVSNDSLALFYVHFRKVSIKYNVDSINDIVISTKEDEVRGDELLMDMAFIKKHNSLYFIAMSPIHEGQQLSPDDLLKMLKK